MPVTEVKDHRKLRTTCATICWYSTCSLTRQPPPEKSEWSGQLSVVDSYQWNAMIIKELVGGPLKCCAH